MSAHSHPTCLPDSNPRTCLCSRIQTLVFDLLQLTKINGSSVDVRHLAYFHHAYAQIVHDFEDSHTLFKVVPFIFIVAGTSPSTIILFMSCFIIRERPIQVLAALVALMTTLCLSCSLPMMNSMFMNQVGFKMFKVNMSVHVIVLHSILDGFNHYHKLLFRFIRSTVHNSVCSFAKKCRFKKNFDLKCL